MKLWEELKKGLYERDKKYTERCINSSYESFEWLEVFCDILDQRLKKIEDKIESTRSYTRAAAIGPSDSSE